MARQEADREKDKSKKNYLTPAFAKLWQASRAHSRLRPEAMAPKEAQRPLGLLIYDCRLNIEKIKTQWDLRFHGPESSDVPAT